MSETITINIILGGIAPRLKTQLKQFDFLPQTEIKYLQTISDAISTLAYCDYISDSQRTKMYQKHVETIHKTIVKFSKLNKK